MAVKPSDSDPRGSHPSHPSNPPARPSLPSPSPGFVVAGRVRLERILRKGGMGSVWVGTHLSLHVPVAVKFVLARSGDAEAVARFEREARAVAQIRSSNVVKIHDFGAEQGLPYMVMELLEGEDLGSRLRTSPKLSLQAAEKILAPVARGLDRAHEARLIHRDLKPDNIFLSREGDEEVPKLLDFGIAKPLAAEELNPLDEVTQEGLVLGTPHYMSPEQARSLPLDHRSDLWSLAVILYRMITGKRPFESLSASDLLVMICSDPFAPPTSVDPSLPPELDAFFERALAKDREQRFQSAREMAAAFSAIVAKSLGNAPGMEPTPGSMPLSMRTPGIPAATGALAGPVSRKPAQAVAEALPPPGAPRGALVAVGVVAMLVLGAGAGWIFFGRANHATPDPGRMQADAVPASAVTEIPKTAVAEVPAPASASAAVPSASAVPSAIAVPSASAASSGFARPMGTLAAPRSSSTATGRSRRDLGY
jgi:serine/threonine-protein kinase